MAIARLPSFVVDCPDPVQLATFYASVLGWQLEASDGWADVRNGTDCLSFQRVDDFVAPDWPGQSRPQQMHLDLVVDDLDTAEAEVLALGAVKHEHQPGSYFRVFLDPAGHPFCLCRS